MTVKEGAMATRGRRRCYIQQRDSPNYQEGSLLSSVSSFAYILTEKPIFHG